MRKVVRHLAAMAAIVLVGGLLSATLVRLAPGFGADGQQLDALGAGKRSKGRICRRHQLASA